MSKAIREIYGEALSEMGDYNQNLVVLDADVSGSTKSNIFAKKHSDRFFNMGIAEANMIATAAGLATIGKIPFANTFAVFIGTAGLLATRGQVCYGNLNVKLAGAYCGLSDAFDGATHHACEDIAAMRALPNMKIFVPSDAYSTRELTKLAADTSGPVYLRLSRDSYPDLYEDDQFQVGGSKTVRHGRDAVIFACGILVHKALEAADILQQRGLEVEVIDMYSVKPLDEDTVIEAARRTGAVVCAEEHSVIGGLGSAVAQVLARNAIGVPTEFIGVQDVFTETGNYSSLLEKYGLDAKAVAVASEKAINRK